MKRLGLYFVVLLFFLMTACSGNTGSPTNNASNEASNQSSNEVSNEAAEAPKEKISIGGKVFTEQVLLVNLMAELLKEKTHHDISTREGLGSSQVLMQALTDDDIQIFADYTGTGYINILQNELKPEDTPESIYAATKEGYEKEYGFTWLEPMKFSNTWTLIMKKDKAQELNIRTFSDLAAHTSDFIIGADFQFFERVDGYEGLAEKYEFGAFKGRKEMDIGLAFNALDQGEIDVLVGYSTDGLIPALDLVTLEDDRNYFPPYYPAPIMKLEFAEKHPDIVEILNELAAKLDEPTMAFLNAEVDVNKKDAIVVAREYLEGVGLIQK